MDTIGYSTISYRIMSSLCTPATFSAVINRLILQAGSPSGEVRRRERAVGFLYFIYAFFETDGLFAHG